MCAFVSFWLQYRGLLGKDGLLPAESFWSRLSDRRNFWSLPSLLWFFETDFDATVEGVAVLGILASGSAIHGWTNFGVFTACYLCYMTLYVLGQTFFSFQWDILLLETGFSAIFYAGDDGWHPFSWVFRVMVVKFMLMNGVVKIFAECPTWRELTALEFHFASTCLPTAAAWYFHSLPPLLLRGATAVMFVTELVAPVLLLVPLTTVRRCAVVVQVPLQLGIMLTGNYNWFNFHTLVLFLPAWARDPIDLDKRISVRFVSLLVALSALAVAFSHLFPVETLTSSPFTFSDALTKPNIVQIVNRATPTMIRQLLSIALSPTAVTGLYGLILASCGTYVLRRPLRRIFIAVWTLAMVGHILEPCHTILDGKPVKPALPSIVDLRPFHASSAYGLFRSMTGVGVSKGTPGWAGLPDASVVAVPVVSIDVSKDGATWREITFRYKPGDVRQAPVRTAPHQPRLDWQMWFAALGNYQHNPWLLHLLYRILRDDPRDPVLELLGNNDDGPVVMATSGSEQKCKFIRVSRYEYDMTRIPSPWTSSIPGTVSLPSNCTTTWLSGDERKNDVCGLYWTRRRVGDYVPAIDIDVLKNQVIRPQGWPIDIISSSSSSSSSEKPPPINNPVAWLGYLADRCFGRLRAFVGVDFDGYSFLDGPLLVIFSAILVVPYVLNRISLLFNNSRRRRPPPPPPTRGPQQRRRRHSKRD